MINNGILVYLVGKLYLVAEDQYVQKLQELEAGTIRSHALQVWIREHLNLPVPFADAEKDIQRGHLKLRAAMEG